MGGDKVTSGKPGQARGAADLRAPAAQDSTGAGQQRLTLMRVLRWLQEDGLLAAADANALAAAPAGAREQEHPLEVVARQNWQAPKNPAGSATALAGRVLTGELLAEWLAGKVGMDYLRIDPLKLDLAQVTGVVSYAYAARFQFLPLFVEEGEIVVATAEPDVTEWVDTVSHVTGKSVRRVIANPELIRRYLRQFFRLSRSISGASERGEQEGGTDFEQFVELGDSEAGGAEEQHVVNIVDWLLQYAFEQRASDIHIEPRREAGRLRFRIDGVMHQVGTIPPGVLAGVTSRLKILGRMDVSEKRRPQDGRIKTRTPKERDVELRLSTMPTAFGEKLVLRIFDPETVVKGFADLGLQPQDAARWNAMIAESSGILLVCGPTGSGKTTTLYSTLKHLAAPTVNVCTIEDPIEMIEPAFNQTQIQPAIDFDYAAGVRTLLRQDPDIIMVGEIRDRETAEVAIQAALTGHLVLSTIHTNDAPAALTRLLDLGVPSYLLEATLLGVLAQRLVRTLCPVCARDATVDEARWRGLLAPYRMAAPAVMREAPGCDECRGTGFQGRVGIYELLRMDDELRGLLHRRIGPRELRRVCLAQGMVPLRVAGAQAVARGITTLEEVARVAPPELAGNATG